MSEARTLCCGGTVSCGLDTTSVGCGKHIIIIPRRRSMPVSDAR